MNNTIPFKEWDNLIESSRKIKQKCKYCGDDMELINGIQLCKCGGKFDGWKWWK